MAILTVLLFVRLRQTPMPKAIAGWTLTNNVDESFDVDGSDDKVDPRYTAMDAV
jgi:hypothetical protein